MQIVTFFFSAWPTTCLSASAQFFMPFVVVHAAAVAGEADDVGKTGFACRVDALADLAQALVPVFLAVEALGDAMTGRHRADEVVFFKSRKCFWADQIDALVSQLGPARQSSSSGSLV